MHFSLQFVDLRSNLKILRPNCRPVLRRKFQLPTLHYWFANDCRLVAVGVIIKHNPGPRVDTDATPRCRKFRRYVAAACQCEQFPLWSSLHHPAQRRVQIREWLSGQETTNSRDIGKSLQLVSFFQGHTLKHLKAHLRIL